MIEKKKRKNSPKKSLPVTSCWIYPLKKDLKLPGPLFYLLCVRESFNTKLQKCSVEMKRKKEAEFPSWKIAENNFFRVNNSFKWVQFLLSHDFIWKERGRGEKRKRH